MTTGRRAPRAAARAAAGARLARGAGACGRCPNCGAAVLVTPGGELLEPEPHPLAITRPDGTRLTLREAVDQAAERTPPTGHHVHVSGPLPRGRIAAPGYGCRAAQLALFGAA
ncbi:hypothetical protein [Streptomyces sp. NPDC002580]|uniref:hypothetical protein n=1 Tax=Streptomyces sp. NPDC002580 TaxID=3364653 RepID=UPI003689F82B